MSGIYLRCIEGGDSVEVPLSKTVIGRGPFLQVTDKRVSRSHAELQVVDGKLQLTPIHTNPCFLRKQGKDQVVLPKDEQYYLEDGDIFGLLPGKLFFEVSYKKVKVNGTVRSADVKDESTMETKTAKAKSENTPDRSLKNEDPDDDWDKVNDEVDKFKTRKSAKANLPVKKEKTTGPAVVKPPGKKEMAMPLDKKRTIPAWMMQVAAAGPVPQKKKPAPKIPAANKRAPGNIRASTSGTAASAPQKRKRKPEPISEDEEEESVPTRRTPKRKSRLVDEDSEELSPRSRPQRAARQLRGSYVDDFIVDDSDGDSDGDANEKSWKAKDDDSDFVVEDDGSGSDWESKKKKGRGKGKGTPGKSPGRRGRPRKSHSEDSGEDGEAYVPRPSKRRGATKRKTGSDGDDDSEDFIPKKKNDKKSRKPKQDSDGESEDNGNRKKKAKKSRKPCEFGKKCYRKNPAHFKEFCHPGDASYDEDSGHDEKNDDSEDDLKPECEFGAACYRKNPQHWKNFSHNKKKGRPKRKAATNTGKKSVLDGDEDDESLPNTYDYNDSFIDDKMVSDSDSSYLDPADEDSDYQPDSEAVTSLRKEAKGFIKNKKMVKPVGKKIIIKPD